MLHFAVKYNCVKFFFNGFTNEIVCKQISRLSHNNNTIITIIEVFGPYLNVSISEKTQEYYYIIILYRYNICTYPHTIFIHYTTTFYNISKSSSNSFRLHLVIILCWSTILNSLRKHFKRNLTITCNWK